MRTESTEHKHLISTNSVLSDPPAGSSGAPQGDLAWLEDFEDAYEILSSGDSAFLDQNMNDLANISELELTPTIGINNDGGNTSPDPVDKSQTLMDGDNNMMDEVMTETPFEEMQDIEEVVIEDPIPYHDIIKLNMPTSPSLDIELDTGDMGQCEIKYTQTKNCQRSEFNKYYHVARDTGILKLGLKFTDIKLTDEVYIIRTVLVRKNEELKHFPGYFLPSQKTRCTKLQGPNFPDFSEHHLPAARS